MIYAGVRRVLFRLDPERAHALTLGALRAAGALPLARWLLGSTLRFEDPRLAVEAFGLRFRNPLGLAAGYDKNGIAVRGLACLGFGHIEIGTLTRGPQPGNPRPRLWRAPEARAVINRLGFPNDGASAFMDRGWSDPGLPVGINIGKSKDTSLDHAAADYIGLLERVAPRAAYVAVNISSPNTPELRRLQTGAFIADLCGAIGRARDQQTAHSGRRLPVLVKVAPDLELEELDTIIDATLQAGLDGLIATNTTLSREATDGFRPERYADCAGGLSGAPLRARATNVIRHLHRRVGARLPIIGVGGIGDVDSAIEKIRAGATLIQLYTGLIYGGPGLPARIKRGLAAALDRQGADSMAALSASSECTGDGRQAPREAMIQTGV